jgi:hypothetical protein
VTPTDMEVWLAGIIAGALHTHEGDMRVVPVFHNNAPTSQIDITIGTTKLKVQITEVLRK